MDDNKDQEPKIIVYQNKSILYDSQGKTSLFTEGKQSVNAKHRYEKIKESLDNGFLDNIYHQVNADLQIDDVSLPEKYREVLNDLTNSVTSEKGRALVVLTVIQLTIKSICPEQSIRLHKSSNSSKSFSWTEGISMRSLDSNYITPFLRKYNLLKLNKFGAFMTRSLAENYPYSKLYKAEIRGAKDDWTTIVDAIENNMFSPQEALKYMISILKNQSDEFKSIADQAHKLAEITADKYDFNTIRNLILKAVTTSNYKARIFEVAIHSLLQSLQENHYLDGRLSPMTQMRSANKKHGNVGDVEVYSGHMLIESWDAKYGKEYLRDELEELNDKLMEHPNMKVAGFITDKEPQIDTEIRNRKNEITQLTGIPIEILSFSDWVHYEMTTNNISDSDYQLIGKDWLIFFVDSLGQKRRDIAPIDEPTEEWLKEIIKLLQA